MFNSLPLKAVPGLLIVCILLMVSCNSGNDKNPPKPNLSSIPPEFENYWDTGETEISTYDLLQSHNGKMYHGEAVLIFETEQFSKSRQIKTDKKEIKKGDVVQVMRMNQSRSFNTGLFTNSTMSEVHVPVKHRDGVYAFKVSCSSQDVMGQSYSQLTLDVSKYTVQLRSYLETEGDQNRVALLTFPEDQLWCNLRMNPKELPSGEMMLIPGLISNRFRNTEITALKAQLKLSKADSSELGGIKNMLKYSISYVTDNRKLEIFFNATTPYEIYGWKETYRDGSGLNAHQMTSTAIRKKIIKTKVPDVMEEIHSVQATVSDAKDSVIASDKN